MKITGTPCSSTCACSAARTMRNAPAEDSYHSVHYDGTDVVRRLQENKAWAPRCLQAAFDEAIKLAEYAEAEVISKMSPYSDRPYYDITHYPKLVWLLAERPPEGNSYGQHQD